MFGFTPIYTYATNVLTVPRRGLGANGQFQIDHPIIAQSYINLRD